MQEHFRILASTLCGLFAAAAAVAQPVGVVDLATTPLDDGRLLRVLGTGSAGQGATGVPVAGGHDVDGDGFEDFAIAFLTADPNGRSNAGQVALVFGDGKIAGEIDAAVPQARVLMIWGDEAGENAGTTIDIDDVTGDGIGDLLICRQNFGVGGTRNGAGALTIVKGGPELRTFAAGLVPFDLRAPAAALTATTVVGANAGDRLCIWARAGDVTGDGVSEVLIGADQQEVSSQTHAGAAYLLLGGAHLGAGGTLDLQNLAAPALAGKVAHITAGASGFTELHFGSTTQIADLDGNGRGELLIAASLNRASASLGGHGQNAESDGRVDVLWDDNFELPWSTPFTFAVTAPPEGRTTILGATANRSLGEEIQGGFDYDASGAADLFLGDLAGNGFQGSGEVLYDIASFKGATIDLDAPPLGLRTTHIDGPPVSFALGGDTAITGDFDGDGLGDLAFCSPKASPQGRINAGMIHVFLGRSGGWPAVIDTENGNLPPPSQVETIEIHGAHGDGIGTPDGDILCYSAARGDVNGDGKTDIIVNEMVGDGSSLTDVGNLLVINGGAMMPIFEDDFELGNPSAWSRTAPP